MSGLDLFILGALCFFLGGLYIRDLVLDHAQLCAGGGEGRSGLLSVGGAALAVFGRGLLSDASLPVRDPVLHGHWGAGDHHAAGGLDPQPVPLAGSGELHGLADLAVEFSLVFVLSGVPS